MPFNTIYTVGDASGRFNVVDASQGINSGDIRRETLFITTHHTAGDGVDIAITALKNRKLSYSFIVGKDGTIYQLVTPDKKSFHAYEANNYSPSICLEGLDAQAVIDYQRTNPKQMQAAVALGRWLQAKYRLPPNSVYGHGEIAMPREKELTEGVYLASILRNNLQPPPYPIAAVREVPEGSKKYVEVRPAGFVIGTAQRVDYTGNGSPSQNTLQNYFDETYLRPLQALSGNAVATDFVKNIDNIKVNLAGTSVTLRQSVQAVAVPSVGGISGELALLGAASAANLAAQEEVRSVLSRVDGLLPAEAAFLVQQNLFEFFPDKMRQKMSINAGTGINPNYAHAWRSPGKLAVTANITIPGASGFRIGQIFWIGRTYEHYKKEGAFQLFGLTEKIDTKQGWTTEIYARFNVMPRTKVLTLRPV